MKYAQLVIGPAGCGKSTYCYNLQEHCRTIGRSTHIINLDPAAEHFQYQVSIDVRDLITLEDVMEELELGPNGGLLYCMEFLEENMHEWLGEELEGYGDDDYIVIDCPGQIELYTHIPVLRGFVDYLKNDGWNVCAVYCLDAHFITDASKFISGCFQALSAMITLEVPHLNVLTKVDLLPDKGKRLQDGIDDTIFPDGQELLASLSSSTGPRFKQLNKVVADLVDGYGMVAFTPLDISDEHSISDVLMQVDMAIQYGEDMDVKVRDFDDADNDEAVH